MGLADRAYMHNPYTSTRGSSSAFRAAVSRPKIPRVWTRANVGFARMGPLSQWIVGSAVVAGVFAGAHMARVGIARARYRHQLSVAQRQQRILAGQASGRRRRR